MSSKVFIIPVSAGKDSQAVLRWALERHDRKDCRVVHQFTGYDHPLTLEHLRYMERRYRVNIEFTRSEKYKDIFDFIRQAGYFPNALARGCTGRLKQYPFGAWLTREGFTTKGSALVYLGMRADESATRASKYGALKNSDIFSLTDISPSAYPETKFGQVQVCLPIVTWSTEKVFAFLAHHKDKVNPLYKKGHKRVGCYPCLLANNFEWEQASKDPTGQAHIKKLLKIEAEFKRDKNPRKFIKIHKTRDVATLLKTGKAEGNDADECGYCSI